MRINELLIENFRGVRRANLTDLRHTPLITIAGRNGVGKSLCLLAILLAWERTVSNARPDAFVGPWGSVARVTIAISLTSEEWEAIESFARQADITVPPRSDTVRMTAEFNNLNRMTTSADPSEVSYILHNETFRERYDFANIDLIPSERSVSRGDLASINPQVLTGEQVKQLRESTLGSSVHQQGLSLYGVHEYLATLDYVDLMRLRTGQESAGDFENLTDGFRAATGKVIERPGLRPGGRITMFVDAGGGNRHPLGFLSSGEQEALGLMYLVRRLGARGGILLIDEPELHLHPSLQRTILAALDDQASRAQLWLSTHSPGLITSASLNSLVTVHPARTHPQNQFERMTEEPNRLEMLSELGMPPSAWQQGDYLVIVEGPTDERYLAGFLPLEMSRALVLVGGSAGAVVQVSRTLSGKKGLLPWIAIRDRDLSNAEEVKQLTSSDDHLFVWPGRAIENFFLDGRLISATLKRAGIDRLPIVVESELKALADAEREEVTNRLLERRLRESYPGTQPERRNDVYAWYMAEAETANQRATGVQLIRPEVGAELDQRWPVEWKEMVQAKRVLSKYLDRTPFRTLATFTDAAVQACKAEPALTPPPIVHLRERLHEL